MIEPFVIYAFCDKVQRRVRIDVGIVVVPEIPEYEELGRHKCNYQNHDCPELCLPKERAIEEVKRKRKRTK